MAADSFTTDQPITGGGIRSVNFFNGRLLTGEDMTREQQANRLGRMRLGKAVGSGVASGLEVSASLSASDPRPVLRVEAGIAVNRLGQVLELPGGTDVALTQERLDGSGADVVFTDCTPPQPGTYTAGAGVYLFSIAPAETGEGRAKVSGLGNEDATCNIAFSIEGVQFHLLRLALPSALLAKPDLLRNSVAHLMFGTDDERRTSFGSDPLGMPVGSYGLLDDLRETGCLGDAHVPLAVLSWTPAKGIRFVDLWSVRRRIVAPPGDRRMPLLVGDRRQAEAEATFLQFQAQIAELVTAGGGLTTLTAADRFEFLPPVGIVPITGGSSLVGFAPDSFLGGQGSTELATTDAALVRVLVAESLAHAPIAVGKERVQRYVIWENEHAVEGGHVGRRALVFAKRTLPYRGIARFGRARFGRSRFAPSVI
jgi:hypothetical protein